MQKLLPKVSLTSLLPLLLWCACDLPNQPGPMPTDIIHTEFEPGMNIFGVLRLDDSTGTSFVYVERAYRTEELDSAGWDETWAPDVSDAEVLVQRMKDGTIHRFTPGEDSLRGRTYSNHGFTPKEGEQYVLTITAPGLPELTAATTVPVKPSIDSPSLVVSDNSVSFDLLFTTDSELYDVYLMFANSVLHRRIVKQDEEWAPVHFAFSSSFGEPLGIDVYGYDPNLSKYLTASITIKPQTYQETVTTVTGGYGCFGSVSRTRFHI